MFVLFIAPAEKKIRSTQFGSRFFFGGGRDYKFFQGDSPYWSVRHCDTVIAIDDYRSR